MTKKRWTPIDLSALKNYRVVAADPSLTAFGLVAVEFHEGVASILEATKFSVPKVDGLEGWEDTFERVRRMENLLETTLSDWAFQWGDTYLQAVTEAPPIGGGPLVRREVSMLTGYAFTRQVEKNNIDLGVMVMPQAHKWLVCGNARATKTEHHEALKKIMEDILDSKLITNEATRDALSVALYAAWRNGL